MVRRNLRLWPLLLMAVTGATAQPLPLDDSKRAALTECGSVVIVKCDRPAAEAQFGPLDPARQPSRLSEPRRQSLLVQQLDGVVIEGEALRRRSLEEVMNLGLPPARRHAYG